MADSFPFTDPPDLVCCRPEETPLRGVTPEPSLFALTRLIWFTACRDDAVP